MNLSEMDSETLIFWALNWMIERQLIEPLAKDSEFEKIHRNLRDIQVELSTRVAGRASST